MDTVLQINSPWLGDIVEIGYLQQLQDTFAKANGVASIIRNPEGKPITRPSQMNRACLLVHSTSGGRADCIAHFQKLTAMLQSNLKTVYGRCHQLGLLHAGIPIVVKGRHIANWWISQRRQARGVQNSFDAEIKRLWQIINDTIRPACGKLTLAGGSGCSRDGNSKVHVRQDSPESLVVKPSTGAEDVGPAVNNQDFVTEQLGRKTALLDAINQVFQAALGNAEQRDLAARCLTVACRLAASRAGMILEKIGPYKWRVLADTGKAAIREFPEFTSTDRLHSSFVAVLDSGAGIIRNRLCEPVAWPDESCCRTAANLMAVPLIDAGRIFGLMVLTDKIGDYDFMDQNDVISLAAAFSQALLRKRAETALATSERRLNLALDAADEGLWDFDIAAGRMYYSPKSMDLLGYPHTFLDNDPQAWYSLVHPDDKHILNKHTVEGGYSRDDIRIEVRMRRADGTWRWMRIRGKLVRNAASGVPVRMIGTICDIHDYMQAQAALEKANEKLKQLAAEDELTRIGNRRRFDQHLVQQWRKCRRDKACLSMIICDIDYFKLYNDTYGHIKGDCTLQAVAQAIEATLKRSTDLVARFGGEEFAVILPDTDQQGALAMAGEIRAAVEHLAIEHRCSQIAPHVTISLGVATMVPGAGKIPHQLVKSADQALYKAKSGGRNTIGVDDPGIYRKTG